MKRQCRRRGAGIAHQQMADQAHLIMELGPVRGGWRNDYARVWSKRTYSPIERTLLHQLRAWGQVRHPKKSRQWATAQ
jgi:RNA-directed DNA polymerase